MRDLATQARATVQRHPAEADAILAILIAVAAIVSVEAIYSESRMMRPGLGLPNTGMSIAAMLAVSLPLAWRRRYVFTSAALVVAGFLFGRIVVETPEVTVTFLATMLAIYSVAVHGGRFRHAVVATFLVVTLVEVAHEIFVLDGNMHRPRQGVDFAYNAVVLILPWILGAAIRSMRERQRELSERASELQREREVNERQAVFAERVRIARELHDVVAHHVSVMGVQAGAARQVLVRQPDRAIEALSSIEQSSRDAVTELHRLLGFLRRADDTIQHSPQPGLAQLSDLVGDRTQSDLAVDLAVDGTPRKLSDVVELSAYRIIQEALTNVRKHAHAGSAQVRLSYGTRTLEVDVLDDGATPAALSSTVSGGHGLIGMRERATLLGGEFHAGPRPGGGFGVHATIPLNGIDR